MGNQEEELLPRHASAVQIMSRTLLKLETWFY